ncbi:amino acid/amide ABC transporter membrane protein 1, HAAT family [Candidatus Pantoea symbiotica]|jgi:branched-chain amino acid transport system permease protein|uniref:Amino acid/amide ABC transporter membrane protein 1, HAAT family n=1 Tax=Candidatus Pantoea symbiotica TaxID=1884370 RepID=A0A1I3YY98_9GAMM|nr:MULTISPECIES: branched-chain amino acid ABC transporter permease [Pantoea]KAJ9430569.1 branched-chain amino acid ABC transporter permease [Pantoea sp. YR343]SFK36181.1 amino acid/amide ABC transporter membrane protein 1, HAAT family [Pantoea symbiotica]SFU87783.1 amino acid/amide ABC transporter membrane protein 1, HAAT family [Pantoea sp. YR525]
MDLFIIYAIEVLNAIAVLVIMSVGLAVVFGMMKIVNMAHGEFMMLGGYSAILATNQWGVPIWISMLVIAPLTVGVFGAVIERVIIRHLYGRMIDTMLATWGLSLALIGAATMLFGNTTLGISSPLPSVSIGNYGTSGYSLFMIVFAVGLLGALWLLLRFTTLGLCARATMQNARMAAALGSNPGKIYSLTFGLGAALSGLGGALLAPITGVIPTIGVSFIAKAFITVIGGGSAIIAGTLSASTLFGTISQLVTYFSTPVFGAVALLLSAIVLLRLLPQGITGRFFRRSL